MRAGGRMRAACRALQGPLALATRRARRARRSSKRCSCSRPCGPCSKASSRHRRSGRVQPVRRGPASRKLSKRRRWHQMEQAAENLAPYRSAVVRPTVRTVESALPAWPRAGGVPCARMQRGGSLYSRVTWLLGRRGDNNWTVACVYAGATRLRRRGRSGRPGRGADPRRRPTRPWAVQYTVIRFLLYG